MANVEPLCNAESYAFDLLKQRGWTMRGGAHRGFDLDLDVEHDGTAGKVLFRNSSEAGPIDRGVWPA